MNKINLCPIFAIITGLICFYIVYTAPTPTAQPTIIFKVQPLKPIKNANQNPMYIQ